MNYINATADKFASYVKQNNKKIILFGGGTVCKTYVSYIINKYELSERILYVIDNNLAKQGCFIRFGNNNVPITTIDILSICSEDFCVMITNGDFYSVMKQFNQIRECEYKNCFITAIMQLDRVYDKRLNCVFKDFTTPQIPKIIHYCWFSGNTLPQYLKECISTWREQCPDYEIIRWDESNYDVKKYKYTEGAFNLRKWGYIPDIVRLEVLYEMGGFYFDTDVKIIKNLEDLRYQESFCGRERAGHVNFGGGSGCAPHSKIVKEILDFRKDEPFILKDGRFNAEASGYYETTPLMKIGLEIEDVNQKLDGINVYASEYFSPYNYINGENIQNNNTYSIHYFSGSWLEGGEKLRKETREKYLTIRDELGDL